LINLAYIYLLGEISINDFLLIKWLSHSLSFIYFHSIYALSKFTLVLFNYVIDTKWQAIREKCLFIVLLVKKVNKIKNENERMPTEGIFPFFFIWSREIDHLIKVKKLRISMLF